MESGQSSLLIDGNLVDEIFYQIPEILKHHESFLDVLKERKLNWDSKQKVGDLFLEAVS